MQCLFSIVYSSHRFLAILTHASFIASLLANSRFNEGENIKWKIPNASIRRLN